MQFGKDDIIPVTREENVVYSFHIQEEPEDHVVSPETPDGGPGDGQGVHWSIVPDGFARPTQQVQGADNGRIGIRAQLFIGAADLE